jgi:hypothetical protein
VGKALPKIQIIFGGAGLVRIRIFDVPGLRIYALRNIAKERSYGVAIFQPGNSAGRNAGALLSGLYLP